MTRSRTSVRVCESTLVGLSGCHDKVLTPGEMGPSLDRRESPLLPRRELGWESVTPFDSAPTRRAGATRAHVLALEPGETRTVKTGDTEVFVLPLSASEHHRRDRRRHVRARRASSACSPVSPTSCTPGATPSSRSRATAAARSPCPPPAATTGCRRATAPPRTWRSRSVAPARPPRQVTNFGSPEAWAHADRLMCVELLTPDGNWSSYPPHKHDDSPECPVNNEEIYYFRIGVAGSHRLRTARFRAASHLHRRRAGSTTTSRSATATCT